MIDFKTDELSNVDSDDISDVLVKVEKSFGFKFGKTELKDVKTFGELCDIITNRVQGENTNECTTQQAFYKLRNAIATTLSIDKTDITPDTNLHELFLRKNRRLQIAAIEKELGFKMQILRPRGWISTTLTLAIIISLVGMFLFWKLALGVFIATILAIRLATKFSTELDLTTLRELAEKIARENYLKSRRNPSTLNKKEITATVIEIFSDDLVIEKSVFTREARFD